MTTLSTGKSRREERVPADRQNRSTHGLLNMWRERTQLVSLGGRIDVSGCFVGDHVSRVIFAPPPPLPRIRYDSLTVKLMTTNSESAKKKKDRPKFPHSLCSRGEPGVMSCDGSW